MKSSIAMKSVLSAVSALSVLSAGCVTYVTPPDYTFTDAQGLYTFNTIQTYVSVDSSPRAYGADLSLFFNSATASSVSITSSSGEVIADIHTDGGTDTSVLFQSDFAEEQTFYPQTERYYTSAWEATIQARSTNVVHVSNGCDTETREYIRIRLQDDQTIELDTYLETVFVDLAGATPGIIACGEELSYIAANLYLPENDFFRMLVEEGAVTQARLNSVQQINVGIMFNGAMTSSSEEGAAVAPLTGSGHAPLALSARAADIQAVQQSVLNGLRNAAAH